MNELKSNLKAAPRLSDDARKLQEILSDLKAGGAVSTGLTPEQQRHNEDLMSTEFAKAQSVDCIPQSAQVDACRARAVACPPVPPAPAAPVLPAQAPVDMGVELGSEPQRMRGTAKVFLTGLPGTNLLSLVEHAPKMTLINLREMAADLLRLDCSLNAMPPAKLINEFRDFGDGQFALTLSSLFFLGRWRERHRGFGKPGYWAEHALSLPPTKNRLVVVGVRTVPEFKAFLAAGFVHYHVMASAPAKARRADVSEVAGPLAVQLDNDAHKKISAARNGPLLNVVWNDDAPAPGDRFFGADNFRMAVLGMEPRSVEADTISQVL